MRYTESAVMTGITNLSRTRAGREEKFWYLPADARVRRPHNILVLVQMREEVAVAAHCVTSVEEAAAAFDLHPIAAFFKANFVFLFLSIYSYATISLPYHSSYLISFAYSAIMNEDWFGLLEQ